MRITSLLGLGAVLLAASRWIMKRKRKSFAQRASGFGMSSIRWMTRALSGPVARMFRMSGRGIRAMIR